jgi:uncharacterized protein with NAD-binding domain and iron-sulfur cluster
MSDAAGLPRIAILGGGAGSVTAAVHLSERGWEKRFSSITLYQQGWRLGGKGASGRGPNQRIEEHGLHIWFGFYENAFRMLRRCHDELDRLAAEEGQPRWPLVFTTVDDSFQPCSEISLTDYDGCGWKLWVADFFEEDDDVPWAESEAGDDGEPEDRWSVAFYMARCLRLAADVAWSLVGPRARLEIVGVGVGGARQVVVGLDEATRALQSLITGDIEALLNATADAVDALVEEGLEQPFVLRTFDLVIRALDFTLDFLRMQYDDLVTSSDAARRSWYVIDVLIAIVRGVIEDGVIEAEDFSVIDDVDFREWLIAHGAARESADCALVRAVVYDLAFGFEGGDPQRPSCGAGTALRGLLRTFFTYRGALMWKMNASMGDVVFAPLYELLVKRGVDVRFFHRVEAVRAANRQVEEIEIDVQAHPPAGTHPLAYLGVANPEAELGTSEETAVWPASPLILAGGSGAAVPSADVYESWYLGRSVAKVDTTVLRRGADKDGFDVVVFGLPIGCVPYVAPDLVAQSDRWKAAVEHVRTVPTQAMQLWLNQPAPALGAAVGTVVGGFVEPFDTWADMEHLVPLEDVPDCATVAYFCNVLADAAPPRRGHAEQWLRNQLALVRSNAVAFLMRDIGTLWPEAVDPHTMRFNWDLLVDPSAAKGLERLDAQYLRANVEPSERYVLSVPGSSAYRIHPSGTGFSNLYAVGDWTACMLDAGCVEAAVISGVRAANEIHSRYGHSSNTTSIVGEEHP